MTIWVRKDINVMAAHKLKIAIAAGDPAGIGPEIALKAALDQSVRAGCNPLLVCDAGILARHAKACGIAAELHIVKRVRDADWSPRQINVLDCPVPDGGSIALGAHSAVAGQASIAFCRAAIGAARAGEVDAVVGAPQNETSVALAGIPFDGHPSLVARETGSNIDDVYMMLCFGETRIAHVTLHKSVREAIAMITHERVTRAIRATDRALKKLGIAAPKICVSGLNPHAGEDGLFGREEIEIIKPAMEAAAKDGISVTGPVGADIMFNRKGYDAFLVMLHDQGHVAAKVLSPNAAAAITIGVPTLFASVAHGSAHDIAGKGLADPAAMIEAVRQLTKARG
jgi:4-hydroxythreonine-4-phosphate dehydrogenase